MKYIKLLKYCHKWLDCQPAVQFLGVTAIVRVQNTDFLDIVALNGLTVPDPSNEKGDRSTQTTGGRGKLNELSRDLTLEYMVKRLWQSQS